MERLGKSDNRAQILEVCYKAGVTHVTIYAFSIENFKRSKYEVDALMEMAKIKLKQLVQHGDLLDRYGARIRILGQRELIKPDVLEAVDRAVEMTSKNGNCVLNICFPYTSREEITSAIRDTVQEYSQPLTQSSSDPERKSPFKEERIANTIRSQHLSDYPDSSPTYLQPHVSDLQSPSSSTTSLSSLSQGHSEHDTSSVSTSTTLHQDDTSPPSGLATKHTSSKPQYPSPELITPQTLTSHMYTSSDPPIDLLIRTSGVSRLSDFMLWQCHETTQIVFLDVLWPDFDLWSFLPVLWEWQWRTRKAGTGTDGVAVDEDLQKKRSTSTSSARNSGSVPSRTKGNMLVSASA